MKFAGEVRQAMVELGPATVRLIAARLDIPEADYAGRERVRQTVRDLEDYDLAAKVPGKGKEAWYAAVAKGNARGEAQAKVWFAVRLHGSRGETFTRKDLAVLSGASGDYLKRYLRFLLEGGYIETAGKVRMSRFGTGNAYRQVREKDREAPPRWHRRQEEAARQDAKVQEDSCPACRAATANREAVRGIIEEMKGHLGYCVRQGQAAQDLLLEMERDLGLAGESPEAADGNPGRDPDQS